MAIVTADSDDLPTHRLRQVRARCQLDNLLAAALDRAFAFAEGHDAALSVAHDLHFDVPRAHDQALGIERAVAERRLRLGRGPREGVLDVALPRDDPHAATAPARDCLDDDAGLAMLGEEGLHARDVDRALGARQNRRLVLPGMGAGPRLVAEQVELLGRGADEGDSRRGAGLGEGSVLRQEAVSRMHGIAACFFRGRDHARNVEIGGSTPALERPHLVNAADMQRGRVVFRMDAHRGNAEFGGGLGDADGDLAAIGDQEFLEHVGVG